MRHYSTAFLALAIVFVASPVEAGDTAPLFEVQRLSDRVLVFQEVSPWESNHVVIVGSEGLVLVDPGHTELMGRLIRQAVAAELGRDRFEYVVDTHGHWGHTWGNSAFPEAIVIGHEQALRTIEADRVNLQRRADFIQGQIEETQRRLGELDPACEEARETVIERNHLERIASGLGESGFVVGLPRLTFSDRLGLDLGDLTLQLVYLGRGHSQSDIAIMIPEEKILLIGCFFLERGPLPVFGTQTILDPDRWLEVFGEFLEDEGAVEHVVLGQHTVWPRQRLVEMRDYMDALWTEVKALEAEGIDLETAQERLPMPSKLDFVREAGASEEDLAGYHRFESTAMWRQLKESAATRVEEAINQGGLEAGIALYKGFIAGNDTDVYFDEAEFNLLGYRYLGQDQIDEAIAVFEINVESFPESWNVYDSLGEAYAIKGNTERAIELYRRSVEINPENINGIQALERLGSVVLQSPTES